MCTHSGCASGVWTPLGAPPDLRYRLALRALAMVLDKSWIRRSVLAYTMSDLCLFYSRATSQGCLLSHVVGYYCTKCSHS